VCDILSVLNVAILGITAVIVWYYTWETKRLREATQRQIELQLRPFLVVRPVPGGSSVLDRFYVYNIGNGAALNIRISHGATYIAIPFLPHAERVEVIRVETGEARALNESAGYSPPYGHYAFPLITDTARQAVALNIEYGDVEGERYGTKVRIGPSDAMVETARKMPLSPP
jgi:hypothetical protein